MEDGLIELTLDDFNRYPSRPCDYVESSVATRELLEMGEQPFLDDFTRRANAEQVVAGLATCIGDVLGPHRVRDCKRGELLEYAPDFAGEMARETVIALRKTLAMLKRQDQPGLTATTLP
jgi:hypothetical protein